MRAGCDLLAQANRIVRGIEHAGRAMAVIVNTKGRLEALEKDSPRFAAMLASADFSARVVGVFMPGITAAQLLAEVSE